MLSVQQFLTKKVMNLMPHRPYSPDLALSNFFVSPGKKSPRREMLCPVEEVKQKAEETLKGINIDKFKNLSSGKSV